MPEKYIHNENIGRYRKLLEDEHKHKRETISHMCKEVSSGSSSIERNDGKNVQAPRTDL